MRLTSEVSPICHSLFNLRFSALFGGFVVGGSLGAVGQVLLFDVVAGEVVGIAVVFAVSHRLAAGVVAVAQVLGDGEGAMGAQLFGGAADGDGGGVALGGGGQVGDRLGESELGFREADEHDRLGGGVGQHQRHGVGVADVFGGQDDQAAGDKLDVLSGQQHLGQPVEGGVGVGAA